MSRALEVAGAALGGRTLRAVGDPLLGRPANAVVRASVDGGPRTVVVKTYDTSQDAEAWVREAAALTLLRDRAASAPTLLAVAADPALVVTADLGVGRNVADVLLGDDPAAAAAMVTEWARAVAGFHAATVGAGAEFAEALASRAAEVAAPAFAADSMPWLLESAARDLAEQLPQLGITPPSAALDELRAVPELLDGAAMALTPADTCPDNNLMTADGLVLLDFEGATVRHVAWDAAYLDVPWPSCWCSWRLPDALAAEALAAWKSVVAPAIPVVSTPAFDEALAVASVAWAFLSTSWFLPRSLTDNHTSTTRVAPSLRALLQHRLAAAATTTVLPSLATLAADVLAALREHWGDVPLALAPAFR